MIDDHLLRDWMVGPDRALLEALGAEPLATTNLWYVRLCRSAARARGAGALLGHLNAEQHRGLVAALVTLPEELAVVPMRDLAWRMGVLSDEGSGLSALGAEAVATAEALGARLLVSSRDDSPGLRSACGRAGVRYAALTR